MNNHDHYTYRVTWSNEDEEYLGLCAEFPSLSWLDQSPEKALTGIRAVVNDVITDLRQNHEPIPEPFANRKFSGRISVRVSTEVHRRLAIEAAEAGVSLNQAVKSKLEY